MDGFRTGGDQCGERQRAARAAGAGHEVVAAGVHGLGQGFADHDQVGDLWSISLIFAFALAWRSAWRRPW
jgi:hypothetical protein